MTQRTAELPLGRPFGRDQFFRFVELTGAEPWYYANIGYSRFGAERERLYLFTSVRDVQKFIAEAGESYWIKYIMLATPPSINATRTWQMEELTELRVATTGSDLSSLSYIHRLADGRSYIHGHETDIEALGKFQVIYCENRDASPESDEFGAD